MLITDQWTRTVLRVLGASIVAIVALAMLLTRTAYANDIAHFDVYTDRDTIHLLTGHGRKGDPSIALFHRRSVDGGATWSAPVRVNRDDDRLSAHHPGENPSVAADGDRIIVAWTAPRPGARRGGLIATRTSVDGGKTWHGGPTPFQPETGSQTFMELAAAGSTLHMVWLDSRTKTQSLRYARSDDFGKTWSSDRELAPRTCECCWNSLMVGTNGSVVALYRGAEPRDIMATASNSAGQWTAPTSVGNFDWRVNACPHVGGAVTQAADGLHALAWTGRNDQWGVYHTRSGDLGATWSPPTRLGTEDSRNADLATAPDGAVIAVWDEPSSRTTRIRSARIEPRGSRWSVPVTIATLTQDSVFPRVAATKQGIAMFWFEGETRRGAMLKVNGREIR